MTDRITAVAQSINDFWSTAMTSPLKTSDGGTGLNTFTTNGVFFASNSSTMAQATGSDGQVLQAGSGGTPEFDDLDGGTF